MHLRFIIEKPISMGVVSNQCVDFHHLAVDDSGTVAAGHTPKGKIRTSGKGSIKDIAWQIDLADRERDFQIIHLKRPRKKSSINRRAKKARIGLKSRRPPSGGRTLRNKLRYGSV